MRKIAFITGGNRGLGLETARQLGRAGVRTIIGSRDAAKGLQAARELCREGIVASSVQLDVSSAASVQSAARHIDGAHGRLDILINNGGILPEATAGDAGPFSARLFAETFETNVLGPVKMIEEFLPLLRKSAAGRIVNVSSTMGSLADQSDPASPWYGSVLPAYQTSKAALNGITIALSKLLEDTPIKVNSICPGFVQTELTPINKEQAPLTAEAGSSIVVETALIAADGPSGRFFDRDGSVAW